MMVCAVCSTTGLESVGAGVETVAAFGAGVGFAAKVSEAARRRIGRQMSRVRIIKVNAFKSGRTKNKRFLFISRETFGETTGSNVRTLPTMRLTSRLLLIIFSGFLAACATGPLRRLVWVCLRHRICRVILAINPSIFLSQKKKNVS